MNMNGGAGDRMRDSEEGVIMEQNEGTSNSRGR